MSKPLRVLLAGGGTAGHVNPLLAVAAALREAGFEVECLGTAEGLEAQLIPAAGYRLHQIPRLPLPRRPHPDLLRLPWRLKATVKQVRTLLADFDLAIGFGGYVSTPLYLAARGKTPLIIHEQNAKPGLANKLGARFTNALALTFADTPLKAKRGITRVVGLPLRPAIARLNQDLRDPERASEVRAQAAAFFNLDPSRFTLLITGGSLGALSLNRAAAAAASQLPESVQVIHLTGRGKDTEVREQVDRSDYVVKDYLSEMELALGLADAVVCRCGAGTVAEMSTLGIPALYVPLPIGNGEQRLNATSVVAAGGGRLVADDQLSGETITDFIAELARAGVREKMSQAAREVAPADPTAAFIQLVNETLAAG